MTIEMYEKNKKHDKTRTVRINQIVYKSAKLIQNIFNNLTYCMSETFQVAMIYLLGYSWNRNSSI